MRTGRQPVETARGAVVGSHYQRQKGAGSMKQTTKMSRAVSQLEHIYNALNGDFFEGTLPVPIITVQSKPGTYGHCSVAKVWKRSRIVI